jgi:hypothetical protein
MSRKINRKRKQAQPAPVLADTAKWSESSKRSLVYQFGWRKAYTDIPYCCLRCEKAAIFSADDQKHAYEVNKAYIDQRRNLCADCWEKYRIIAGDIRACEAKWDEAKRGLKKDSDFLSNWLRLLTIRDEYIRRRPDIATQNMLKKLLLTCENSA